MKLLFEFVPVVIFFIALLKYDLYVATAVLMVAIAIQVALFWLVFKRVEKMHLITLALVEILGAATLILQNPLFIKWKPTVVNWLFAVAFLGSQFVSKKTLIQHMLDSKIELPTDVWRKLNWSWIGFFFFMGLANLYVAYQFDTITWAQFKVFGILGLTILFVIGQGIFLSKHISEDNGSS